MKVQFSNTKLYFKTNQKYPLQKRIDELNKISNIGETPVQNQYKQSSWVCMQKLATTAGSNNILFVQQTAWFTGIWSSRRCNGNRWPAHTKLNYGSKAEWIGKMFLLHWYRQPDTIYIKTRIKSLLPELWPESQKNNCSMKSGKRNLRVYQTIGWRKFVQNIVPMHTIS